MIEPGELQQKPFTVISVDAWTLPEMEEACAIPVLNHYHLRNLTPMCQRNRMHRWMERDRFHEQFCIHFRPDRRCVHLPTYSPNHPPFAPPKIDKNVLLHTP
ncbi:expressed protein [Echinococcus multilocularis]|uniref:Expressed protein n=1 Tax=Echinococcus multilocularis TaxID=6211 RepID=A0A068Y3I1_ECHMU|nr:expressed protein [Echinococcus multilocularis]